MRATLALNGLIVIKLFTRDYFRKKITYSHSDLVFYHWLQKKNKLRTKNLINVYFIIL